MLANELAPYWLSAKNGDAEAINTICRLCMPFVLRGCQRYQKDRHLAEDAAQQVLITFWLKLAQIDLQHVERWLLATIRYKSLPEKNRQLTGGDGPGGLTRAVFENLYSREDEVGSDLERDETIGQVMKAYGELPEEEQALLWDYYWDGRTCAAIAVQGAVHPKTISRHITTAVRKIARRLEDTHA